MISVCIATFNGEQYIKEQLDSILPQLKIEDEVIISDDGSSDATLNIVKTYNDARIKIFKNPKKGVIYNFENAIRNALGDYIFLSDQDDIWNNNKVAVCLTDFKNGYDLVLSDCSIFDSATQQIIEPSFFKFNGSKKGVLNNILKNSYIGCCMAFNQKVKNKILPFPARIPMHDSWIGLVSEVYFKVNFNENQLIRYRKHAQNNSYTSDGKSHYSIKKKIFFRINTTRALLIKILKW